MRCLSSSSCLRFLVLFGLINVFLHLVDSDFLFTANLVAQGQVRPQAQASDLRSRPLQLQFFLGYQGLRTHEYVVGSKNLRNSRGHKSELIWNSFKNLLFGAGLEGQNSKLKYYLQVSGAVSLDKNFIYDYDWLYEDGLTEDANSHYSRHDTVQNIMLELLIRIGFPIFKSKQNQIHFGPGLYFSLVHWDAFDGELRYYITGNQGPITGRVLSYGVSLLSFQAYIEFIQNFGSALELRLLLAYSPLTLWLDKDDHYRRDLLFYGYGFWGQQIFGELQFTLWNLKRSFGVSLALTGRYLFETLGGTLTYDSDSEGTVGALQSNYFLSSGIEQGSLQVYAGVVFAFPQSVKR